MNTPVRRAASAAACVLLLAAPAACTGSAQKPAARPSPSPSTSSSAAPQAPPAPLQVRVTRVSGTLSATARRDLERNVGATVSGYLDAAYLGGTYPRSDFSASLPFFSPGLRHQAHADAWLLTNQDLGPTTRSVVPEQRAAYLSVLAPYRVAAGVTAQLRLRYVAERGDLPARRVTVTGRLMLTRKNAGGWTIFGYHLARSVQTVQKGSS